MLFDKDADSDPSHEGHGGFHDEEIRGQQSAWPKLSRNPFRDQGEKTFEGYVAGAKFINASSNTKPGLVDAQQQRHH
jgi:hypothetical protein